MPDTEAPGVMAMEALSSEGPSFGSPKGAGAIKTLSQSGERGAGTPQRKHLRGELAQKGRPLAQQKTAFWERLRDQTVPRCYRRSCPLRDRCHLGGPQFWSPRLTGLPGLLLPRLPVTAHDWARALARRAASLYGSLLSVHPSAATAAAACCPLRCLQEFSKRTLQRCCTHEPEHSVTRHRLWGEWKQLWLLPQQATQQLEPWHECGKPYCGGIPGAARQVGVGAWGRKPGVSFGVWRPWNGCVGHGAR